VGSSGGWHSDAARVRAAAKRRIVDK